MAIVAVAAPQDDFIVPIPFEISPSQIEGNERIIVAIDEIPPSRELMSLISSFYGRENCEILTGKIPPGGDEKSVFCVSSNCIIDKALSQEGTIPPAIISPLWTEDRFGISAEEASIIDGSSHEMTTAIHLYMNEFRNQIENLKINIDLRTINTIKDCQEIIKRANQQLEETKRDCRWMAAEHVAKYLRYNFPVHAWADVMVEPAVFFCVLEKYDDDEAVVLGSSVEGVLNEIEPTIADRFFNVYVPDASVFPIVMDVSFVNGKRVTNREDYLYTMQEEDRNRI
jgi:hypothetical protein